DLVNVSYEILLQIFERFFAHTEETDAQLKVLADATVVLMVRVIKPVGDLITTLPVGPDHPGNMAGPSFELFYESDYLMPHREAAWALLAERLNEAAWLCDAIRTGRGTAIAAQLEPVLDAMREVSRSLAAHLPAGSPHARLAAETAPLAPAEVDALVQQASDLAATVPDGRSRADRAENELGDLFWLAHSIVTGAASGAGCDAGQQALLLPRLVGSVLRPLADVLARIAADTAEFS